MSMGTQLTLNSKDNLVRELLSTLLKHNFHKYLTKLNLRSCCINLNNLSRNLIYEQLFNKFTNVLFIKTPNKNIFISLSLSLWKGRRRSKWSEAELDVSQQSYQ